MTIRASAASVMPHWGSLDPRRHLAVLTDFFYCSVCVCVCARALHSTYVEIRGQLAAVSSPSAMWVLGIELGLSSLVVSAFAH